MGLRSKGAGSFANCSFSFCVTSAACVYYLLLLLLLLFLLSPLLSQLLFTFVAAFVSTLHLPRAPDKLDVILFACPWFKANTGYLLHGSDSVFYGLAVSWVAI